jgi:diaminohydroxyphosphoribosylaminopyrimidine deaminase / 5-amino-6-(5-phosphoribosylamino)uracil reductase
MEEDRYDLPPVLASHAYAPKYGDFFMGEFDKLMTKAFKLAAKGLGYTSPNPPVGAIIIKDGAVIGSGYHHKAGMPHAEIEALKLAGSNARGATIITTLEPCSHHGKTPPCAEAIIEAGITRVVSAYSDPNPVVSGRGFKRLRDSGLEVIENISRELAIEFYAPYTKFITTGLPYVTLKYAQTLDGRIAAKTGHSQWISSPKSLKLSHQLRAVSDAILIGSGTLKADNPKLTTRLVKGKNPIRIVLSASGKFSANRALFTDGEAPTFVAMPSQVARNSRGHFQVISLRKTKDGLDLSQLLKELGKMGIMNLLVEGGAGALTSFMRHKLADKMIICTAPIISGQGIEAIGDLNIKKITDAIKFEKASYSQLGPDMIFSGIPVWK